MSESTLDSLVPPQSMHTTTVTICPVWSCTSTSGTLASGVAGNETYQTFVVMMTSASRFNDVSNYLSLARKYNLQENTVVLY